MSVKSQQVDTRSVKPEAFDRIRPGNSRKLRRALLKRVTITRVTWACKTQARPTSLRPTLPCPAPSHQAFQSCQQRKSARNAPRPQNSGPTETVRTQAKLSKPINRRSTARTTTTRNSMEQLFINTGLQSGECQASRYALPLQRLYRLLHHSPRGVFWEPPINCTQAPRLNPGLTPTHTVQSAVDIVSHHLRGGLMSAAPGSACKRETGECRTDIPQSQPRRPRFDKMPQRGDNRSRACLKTWMMHISGS